MKKSNRQKAKEWRRLAGRQSWGTIKPVTRVIPNKKKAVPDRKAKHKGRHDDAGRFCFTGAKAA